MKKLIFLFCFLGSQALMGSDLPYRISDLPEKLTKDADHVLVQDLLKVNYLSAERYTQNIYLVVAVMKDESSYKSYSAAYNRFEDITNLKITVYDINGKKVESFKKKDFADYPNKGGELYTEDRLLYLDLEKFKAPFLLEIEHDTEHKEDMAYSSFISQYYDMSVVHADFQITHPISFPIQYKLYNNCPEPLRSENEGVETLRWTFDSLSVVEYEASGPRSGNLFPRISARPVKFTYDDYECDMSSWESYNDFYYELNKERDHLTPEMKKIVHESTDDLNNDLDKIDTLYDYLKQNMRYVSVQLGIGGWQTFDAAYVEHNKFGDCKALSNFMGAMLSEAGIENNKVLIYRGVRGYQEPASEYVNTPFNHAILYVPGQEMFLECTSNNYPIGYLGLDNANRKAMIVTTEGPLFRNTHTLGIEENKSETISKVVIKEDGGASIETVATYQNGAHDDLRNAKDRVTKEEFEKGFQKSYSLPISELKYFELKIQDDEPKAELKYAVTVGKYASKAGNRIFIPVNPIHNTVYVPEMIEDRKLPFSSITSETIENQITISIPEGYEIESMPEENYNQESVYGDFRLAISKEEDEIKVYKKWVRKAFEYPADKYDDYRNTLKDFSKRDSGKIVLVKKKT